MKLKKK